MFTPACAARSADDFVFASWRLHGKKPVTPDMVLK